MPRLNGWRTTSAPAARARSDGVVGRAVVDHDDVEVRRVLAELRDDAPIDGGLVVGGDDGELGGHDAG